MSARDQILGGIRAALGRAALTQEQAASVETRVATHPRHLIPARSFGLDRAGLVQLFVRMAEMQNATVAQVMPDAVPEAVATYLARQNLPAEIVMAPDAALDAYPWGQQPLLRLSRGRAADRDLVSVTGAFAGIAETGTLMLISGADRPTTLNFLPDTHIVVLRAGQIVGPYEDGWDRLRAAMPPGQMPRTVNFVTGPSRTADIEQRIQLGAHGPRRLHILLVEEPVSGLT